MARWLLRPSPQMLLHPSPDLVSFCDLKSGPQLPSLQDGEVRMVPEAVSVLTVCVIPVGIEETRAGEAYRLQ